MAQALLTALARARGLDLVATSAGTLPGERTISPLALQALGADAHLVEGHRSRALVADEIRRADLVLGMTREHVREIVIADPAAWPKTFTLKELVRRGSLAGPRRSGEELSDWLARVGGGRSRQELLGSADADDVADPVGAPASVVKATAAEIRGLLEQLLDLVGDV